MRTIREHSLYLVTSREYYPGKTTLEVVESAISGGVDILQMREKGMERTELLELGTELSDICRKAGVVFIVNDDPFLASEVGADGVHLGQEDIKKYQHGEVRNILGHNKIIGVSTHSPEEFSRANTGDADYIAYGPVFPTKTKNYHVGTGKVKELLRVADKPVVLIGGIHTGNMETLLEQGAKNLAMIRSIVQAEDIASQVKAIKTVMDRYRKQQQ
ncbi:MAG: thiamine phosphate synthase [Candidatus Sabulitectum sp.]|nr:thiamine phosphate synthase [Candidatus Sabulitectum sp.]